MPQLVETFAAKHYDTSSIPSILVGGAYSCKLSSDLYVCMPWHACTHTSKVNR